MKIVIITIAKEGKKKMNKNIFLKYAKGLKIKAILAPLFKLLEAILELFIPLVIADIIDNGIPNQNSSYILGRFLILIGFGILGFLFALCAQYFSASVASTYSCRIRKGLFEHVHSLSYKEMDELGTSTLLNRLTGDTNQIQTGINMFLRLFLRSPFIFLGALIMSFIVSWDMGLIFLVSIIILSLIVAVIMIITLPKYRKIQSSLDQVTKETRESLNGVRIIRAFTNENKQIDTFNQKNDNYQKLQFSVGLISILTNPLTVLIVNIAVIMIIYFGGIKVNSGSLTNGQVVALYNYTNYILVELIKFANLIITITKAIACGKRVNSLFNLQSSLKYTDHNKINDDFLAFNNVSFKYYENGREALKDVNFKINKNQTLGVIGGTGSGKTTLINLIGHYYDLNKGQIIFDGYSVDSYSKEELRNKIGFVNQHAILFEGTIRSNLLIGNQNANDEDLKDALIKAQAINVVNKKESGLDEKVEQGGRNFSGGEKQRLTIARALVKKPDLLILDDSSSALDYKTDKDLRHAISQIKDMSIIIVSQRTSALLNCDKIIVLDHGNVIDIGNHEELLNRCKLYQDIHYSQYEKEDN